MDTDGFGKRADIAVFVGSGVGDVEGAGGRVSVSWVLLAGIGGVIAEIPKPSSLTRTAGVVESGQIGKLG